MKEIIEEDEEREKEVEERGGNLTMFVIQVINAVRYKLPYYFLFSF